MLTNFFYHLLFDKDIISFILIASSYFISYSHFQTLGFEGFEKRIMRLIYHLTTQISLFYEYN